MSTCSKAPRGLSVLPWVSRIFTTTTISPDPLLRQRPNRYTFRAGRNLPDKEFRYLRMVIVTTAVYWGLNSPLRPKKGLTGPLNLPAPGRRQSVYINLTVFARTCVFDKQSLPSLLCDPHQLPHVKCLTSAGPPSPEVTGAFCRVP